MRQYCIWLLIFHLGCISTCYALSADEIVERADKIMDIGDFTADVQMEVVRNGEVVKKYQMDQYFSSNGDKILVVFTYPARDKGQAYLRNGEDTWLYMPNCNKTLRLPPRQSFGGGDFNNHDVLSVRIAQDYYAKCLGEENIEGIPAYKLELTAKTKEVVYAQVVYWVAKEGFCPLQRDFYVLSGKHFKTLYFSDRDRVAGRPQRMTMEDVLEKDKKTIMIYHKVERVQKHNLKMFTKEYLTRRR